MANREKIRIILEMVIAFAILAAGGILVSQAHSAGVVVNDKSKAAENTLALQQQADDGRISLPVGTVYINKRIKLPVKIGGRITSAGSGIGYWYPWDHPSHLSDKQSRICQLTPGEPVFLYRGTGVISYAPVWLEGQGTGSAIQIEGRVGPVATGQHRWANWGFYNWGRCFDALDGYYRDDGTFAKDENHADNCKAYDIVAFACDTIFHSSNQQAVSWTFRDVYWQGLATKGKAGIAFDIERGGWLLVDDMTVENTMFDLLGLRDFSPNNNYFRLTGIKVDRFNTTNMNFCWVNYHGPEVSKPWSKYSIEVEGYTASQPKPLEQHTQFKNTTGLPQDDWSVKIHHVKQAPTN